MAEEDDQKEGRYSLLILRSRGRDGYGGESVTI